ncbi:hypothetical protein [Aquimarina algicola]|uniref:Lipoprotein n=1 Tax=Aquimarina algicola TaxID=2589995 RepID=A0A504J9W1_9FLAO|nr:hypothetical protein [Aquimarina algicola]TPN85385.1 hypothetical protein FHK87_15330 [Aquimarina algicola]
MTNKCFIISLFAFFVLSCKNKNKEQQVVKDIDFTITDYSTTFHPIETKDDFNDYLKFITQRYNYGQQDNDDFLLTVDDNLIITIKEKETKWYQKRIETTLDLKKATYPLPCEYLYDMKLFKDYKNIGTDSIFKEEIREYTKHKLYTFGFSVFDKGFKIQKSSMKIAVLRYRDQKVSILCKRFIPTDIEKKILTSVKDSIQRFMTSKNRNFDYALIPVEIRM